MIRRASLTATLLAIAEAAVVATAMWLAYKAAEAEDAAAALDTDDDLDFMLVSCNGHDPIPWQLWP